LQLQRAEIHQGGRNLTKQPNRSLMLQIIFSAMRIQVRS